MLCSLLDCTNGQKLKFFINCDNTAYIQTEAYYIYIYELKESVHRDHDIGQHFISSHVLTSRCVLPLKAFTPYREHE